MNEVNNLTLDAFDQFEVRTRDFVYLDWNPTVEFWYYNEVEAVRTDTERIILTYKDNEALDEATINSIEQRKNRKGWFQVYGLGQLGEVDGKIYTDWRVIDEIPHEAKLVRRGLDFGYSNDHTAIIDIYYYNSGYIFDEILFRKGMSNKQIADVILNTNEDVLVIADSAEPKSIAEIKSYGVMILGAKKQKMEEEGSQKSYLKWSIGIVQDQKISITQRSIDTLKEYRNYVWMTDKDGKILNVPEDMWNDAMDAIRYAVVSLHKTKDKNQGVKQYKPKYSY